MSNLTVKVAETMKNLGVRSVYGDPIELDGVTLIPVALVQYGFGAGVDASNKDDPEESSVGGGLSVPIGAYVRDHNGIHFEPNLISLLAVGIPFVCVAGRALSRVIRALKR